MKGKGVIALQKREQGRIGIGWDGELASKANGDR